MIKIMMIALLAMLPMLAIAEMSQQEANKLIKDKEKLLQDTFGIKSGNKKVELELVGGLCDCGNRIGGFKATYKLHVSNIKIGVSFSLNKIKIYKGSKRIKGYEGVEKICYWEKNSDRETGKDYKGGDCAVTNKKIRVKGSINKHGYLDANEIRIP